MSRRVALLRALRLRCPVCGQGRLFRGWFSMHSHCSQCGLKLEREPGYFLGSTYFNYALTVLLVMAGYLALTFGAELDPRVVLYLLVGVSVVFPLWFFRYARSLWLAFDHSMDPDRGANDGRRKMSDGP
jgi:uncharacterized protein (DUF983 family)